jgi:hypothetical protein
MTPDPMMPQDEATLGARVTVEARGDRRAARY